MPTETRLIERDVEKASEELARHASGPDRGLLAEYWYFLRQCKKWWLLPILLGMLLIGGLIIAGGSSLAPLIYPLF